MDWYFLGKRKVKCPQCNGAGYVPYKNADTSSKGITVEVECKKCSGNKEVWEKEHISLESLKELIDGLK